jgi:hypothetical protein
VHVHDIARGIEYQRPLARRVDDHHRDTVTRRQSAELVVGEARVPDLDRVMHGPVGVDPERTRPVIAEQVRVQRHRVETGRVRVGKVTRQRDVVVNEAATRDEVVVRRVKVNDSSKVPSPIAMRTGFSSSR